MPAPAPVFKLAGAWTGISHDNSTNYILVMPSDGSFRLLNSGMNLGASGSLKTSGKDLSGTITFVQTLTPTKTSLTGKLGGTATSRSINATISSADASINNQSLTLAPDASAATDAQLPGLAGTWSSAPSSNTDVMNLTFTLDAAGRFTGALPGLNASGTVAQPAANANAFTVDLVITPSLGLHAGTPQNLKGTAYLRAGSSQMVLSADNGTFLFGGIFTRQ
ncbi:MAG: hypothetical protein HGA66_09905 [Holophaga sp.]|nr:hypothetical protein [Holophaga sp.]